MMKTLEESDFAQLPWIQVSKGLWCKPTLRSGETKTCSGCAKKGRVAVRRLGLGSAPP